MVEVTVGLNFGTGRSGISQVGARGAASSGAVTAVGAASTIPCVAVLSSHARRRKEERSSARRIAS